MLEYLGALVEFFFSGIYDFVVDTFSYWIQLSVKASLYLTYQMMLFSWDIAQQILQDLNITQTLDSAWSSLDSEALNTANFFQLPQAVGNLVTAFITKFAFRFIGGTSVLS